MFDVAIIGLGAAGYTAAIYSARYKLSTLLIGEEEGGMGQSAAEVGNWPGEIEIKGPDLMEKFKAHALSFSEVTPKVGRVEKVVKTADGHFIVSMQNGEIFESRAVIFATGSKKRHLGIPSEDTFAGRGVSYCATCDAFFYKGKDVAVVGGGDSAIEGAAIVAQVAKRVYLIHRRKEFRAEPYWVERLQAQNNVTFVLERSVTEIIGEGKVNGVVLDQPINGTDRIAVDGVFVEVGSDPATDLPDALGCSLDPKGYVVVKETMETSVPGAFAAGDVTNASNHFAQFATAAGEAAVAANGVFNYLRTKPPMTGGYMAG